MSDEAATQSRRWDDVEFHFYCAPQPGADNAYMVLTGEVREHAGGYVLSLNADYGLYVVRATHSPLGGFAGRHDGADSDVSVHWNSIGDRQVGVWVEDKEFSLFTFILKGYSTAATRLARA